MRTSIVLIALLTAGCFSPVAVRLAPRYEAVRSDVGAGRTVLLEVTDGRADRAVGRRQHGLLPGSRIELETPVETVVQNAIIAALRRKRFNVVTTGGAGNRLSVEVVELHYRPTSNIIGTRIETSAALRVEATSARAHYSQVYRRTDEDEEVIASSRHFSGTRLSAVVADSLRQMMTDQALLAVLATP